MLSAADEVAKKIERHRQAAMGFELAVEVVAPPCQVQERLSSVTRRVQLSTRYVEDPETLEDGGKVSGLANTIAQGPRPRVHLAHLWP